MKIYLDGQQLEAYHPILHIDTFTHTNSEDSCKANITLMCDSDDQMRLCANALAYNNFFKQITIENGKQLFILHNSLVYNISYNDIPELVNKDKRIVELIIELIPETIECQSLVDCFME